MEKIRLTDEEAKTFYYQSHLEKCCEDALSVETINSLNLDEKSMQTYMETSMNKYADTLATSILFLNGLKEKYEVASVLIEDNYLIKQ